MKEEGGVSCSVGESNVRCQLLSRMCWAGWREGGRGLRAWASATRHGAGTRQVRARARKEGCAVWCVGGGCVGA